jgi:hypothetical protein
MKMLECALSFRKYTIKPNKETKMRNTDMEQSKGLQAVSTQPIASAMYGPKMEASV